MAREFHYSGGGFILGQDEQSWAIWHRGHEAGAPVMVYPLTGDGWNQAYATLIAWDPQAVPVPKVAAQANYPVPAVEVAMYQPQPAVPVYQGQMQPYPNNAWGAHVAPNPSNGMATTGGIVGIVGAFLSLIPFAGIVIGLVMGVLAIIFGGVGLSRAGRVHVGKGIAITGLVLGILTVIFKCIPGVDLI